MVNSTIRTMITRIYEPFSVFLSIFGVNNFFPLFSFHFKIEYISTEIRKVIA